VGFFFPLPLTFKLCPILKFTHFWADAQGREKLHNDFQSMYVPFDTGDGESFSGGAALRT